jgi:diguanylate cyclase (GGDEF)-like protein
MVMRLHAQLARDYAPRALHAEQVLADPGRRRELVPDAVLLRLASALQTSLNARETLQAFLSEARRLLRGLSLRYRNPAEGLELIEGRAHPHRCGYELNLLGKSIGEVTFMRVRPLAERELEQLELMLCVLVYPLRNALMYGRALRTALLDPLTGVQNRCSMDQHLEHQVLVAVRHRTPLSMLMVDVDRFKQINDAHGHLVGDAVLAEVARKIVACTRSSDVVFRYGGEEFAVVLTNTRAEGARLLAERIRAGVDGHPVSVGGFRLPVSVSIGVAEFTAGEGAVDLLHRADKQLYLAKQLGRNQVAGG